MQRLYILIVLIFLSGNFLYSQVVWSEDFTYPDGTTTGADNNLPAGADWTATCATCLGGDWFETQSGQMEGRDTNGPAVWTSETIDISSCAGGITFSIDFSESGTMEECTAGCDYNCVDWVKLEYRINGGTWNSLTTAAGGACYNGPSSNGDFLLIGDFTNYSYTSPVLTGNQLELRISVQTWAASEYIQFDNISVSCVPTTCTPYWNVSSVINQENCGNSDGSIALTVNDGPSGAGNSNYTFTWTPNVSTTGSATGLSTGNYQVVISDGTCDTTMTLNVPHTNYWTVDTTNTENQCSQDNGTINLNVTGGPSGAGNSNYTFTWTPNVSTTGSASNLTTGTYQILISNGTCDTTVSVHIAGDNSWNVSSVINQENCGNSDGSIALTVNDGPSGAGNSNYTFTWTPNVSTTGSATGLSAGNYQVVISDGTCDTTMTLNVPQNASNWNISSVINQENCGNSDGSIALTVNDGPSGAGNSNYTFTWTPNVSTTGSATGLSAGNYQVVISDGTCDTTVSVHIAGDNSWNVSSVINQENCGNSDGSIALTVNDGPSGAGNSNYTFTWTPNVSTTGSATGLSAGNYQVVISDGTCDTTMTLNVPHNNTSWNVTSVINQENCGNSDGSIALTVNDGPSGAGNSNYTFTWTPNVSTTGSATGLSTGNYQVVISNGTCDTTMTLNVPHTNYWTVDTTNTENLCFQNDGTINLNVTDGPSGAGNSNYTFTWTPNVSTTGSATNLTTGTYQILISNGTCDTTVSVHIAGDNSWNISSVINQENCGNSDGSIALTVNDGPSGAGNSNYTFTWTPNVSTTGSATGLSAGNYQVVISNGTCDTTMTLNVPQNASNWNISSVINQENCGNSDGSIALTVNDGPSGAGNSNYTFTWTPNVSTTGSATGLSTGNYQVVISNGTCDTTMTLNVPQNASNWTVTSVINQENCGLSDGSIALTVNDGPSGAGNSNYTFTWTPNVSTTGSATGLSTGNYQVVISDGTCDTTMTLNVPHTNYWTVDTTNTENLCFQNDGTINLNVTDGPSGAGNSNYTFTWTPNVSTTGSATNLTTGTYQILISNGTCDTTVSVHIAGNQVPILAQFASAPNIPSTIKEGDIVSFINQSTGATSYFWDFGDGQTSTDENPQHTFNKSGQYCVTLTASNGNCADTSEQCQIDVEAGNIFIPNVFSPNGDGANDEFEIITSMSFSSFQYQIFDRWGKIVFTGKLNEKWNGKIGGNDAPEGVYVLILKAKSSIDDKEINEVHNVTLLR